MASASRQGDFKHHKPSLLTGACFVSAGTQQSIKFVRKLSWVRFFIQRTVSTQTGHRNMNLGFPKPDIRGELQFGNNMLYR
jgi:hypothetical protein